MILTKLNMHEDSSNPKDSKGVSAADLEEFRK